MKEERTILLGGNGSFGRFIATELAKDPTAQLVIAGRTPAKGQPFAASLGAEFAACDINDPHSLAQTIAGAYLVINAAGPFQEQDYTVPQLCLDNDCHYIDLGDGRSYVSGIGRLHQATLARNKFICVGASTSPAVTTAMAFDLRPSFTNIESIKVALSAGNKNQAGASTIESILSYVGAPVRVWQDGRWQTQSGWSEAEFVEFPPPTGRRRVYLCDVPDLELMPQLFEAGSVTFKAGLELNLFNYGVSFLARLRKIRPNLPLPKLTPWLIRASSLFKPFGSFAGGVTVQITGQENGRPTQRTITLVAPQNGPLVPTSPAILLARRLLANGPPKPGAYPCVGFIPLQEYIHFLQPHGLFVVYNLP
jgi:hypothetical protein